jgi:exopolysaccharide biosynthesis polyprenyl glycosylphosphotransferase
VAWVLARELAKRAAARIATWVRAAPWVGGSTLTLVRAAADVASIVLAFGLVYYLYVLAIRNGMWVWEKEPSQPVAYLKLTVVFVVLSLGVFSHLGLYRARASVLNLWELETAAKGIAFTGACFFGVLFFFKMAGYSRAVVVLAIPAAMILVILERRLLAALARRFQLRGVWCKRTLIYGCGETGQLLMKKIVQAPHRGTIVVGFVDDEVVVGKTVSCRIAQTGGVFRVSVVGRFSDLDALISRYKAQELLVAASLSQSRLREVMDACQRLRVQVGVVPCLANNRADQLVVEDLSSIPILRPEPRRSRGVYLVCKRLLDIVVASVALAATLPLWCAAGLLIWLDSKGSILFVQDRVGLNGRRFRILKFRTMRQTTDPYQHSPDGDVDPRITRVGRLLRIGGLDELPQLINVIRGEMSMVGPRPEMPFIVEGYTELQRRRLTVKPGLTGLWQVSADRHSEIHENIEYDLYYIDHQSMLLDLLILVETVLFTCGLIIQSLRGSGRQSREYSFAAGNIPDLELSRDPSLIAAHASRAPLHATGATEP